MLLGLIDDGAAKDVIGHVFGPDASPRPTDMLSRVLKHPQVSQMSRKRERDTLAGHGTLMAVLSDSDRCTDGQIMRPRISS